MYKHPGEVVLAEKFTISCMFVRELENQFKTHVFILNQNANVLETSDGSSVVWEKYVSCLDSKYRYPLHAPHGYLLRN